MRTGMSFKLSPRMWLHFGKNSNKNKPSGGKSKYIIPIIAALALFCGVTSCMERKNAESEAPTTSTTAAKSENKTTTETTTEKSETTTEKSETTTEKSETTTEKSETTTEKSETAEYKYVLNVNSKKIHLADCESAQKTLKKNKKYTNDYDSAIAAGYEPCAICNP